MCVCVCVSVCVCVCVRERERERESKYARKRGAFYRILPFLPYICTDTFLAELNKRILSAIEYFRDKYK